MELTLREVPGFVPPWTFAACRDPQERRGRAERRRAFIDLRLCCGRAAAAVPGEWGLRLQAQVRQACEPIELWLLQSSLLAALPDDEAGRRHREAVAAALAACF